MLFTGVRHKPASLLFFLILWSVGLRIIVYVLLPAAKQMAQYTSSELLFFSALTDHFADYLSFTQEQV